ncbi:MAG: OmpA family protein, partial [SAR324 cluster bacterium]|nr:OmpA family protein [SAR324 cluster bacterium]
AAAETAAETAKETAKETAVQEKLLAQPELQTPETNQAGAFNAIKEAVFEILTIPADESQEVKAEKPVAVPEQEDSSPRFMPTSRLALVSALKLVSCKNVPAKMEDAHQRLLKTKDLNIADRSLRDEINDRLMPVVHFDFDQIKIKPDYQKLLRQQSSCVMKALEARGDMIVQIEGHADERGSDEYNLALGHRRANAIANSIMAYLSDSTLVRILSYGEEFPLESNSGKSAWDKNRRVEFTLLLKP